LDSATIAKPFGRGDIFCSWLELLNLALLLAARFGLLELRAHEGKNKWSSDSTARTR